jgi:hypothetical protein
MGLIQNALRQLFPRGRPWLLPGGGGQLVDGLADTLDRPKAALQVILSEALPGTATAMLPEWHTALGQKYDSTVPIENQRLTLAAIHTNIGGVDMVRLNTQIQKELPGCFVSDPASLSEPLNCYYVNSPVALTDYEYMRLWVILSRYAPLHLQPLEVFELGLENGDMLGLDDGGHMIVLITLDM